MGICQSAESSTDWPVAAGDQNSVAMPPEKRKDFLQTSVEMWRKISLRPARVFSRVLWLIIGTDTVLGGAMLIQSELFDVMP